MSTETAMPTEVKTQRPTPSKAALWAGRVISGLAGVFLLLDGVAKLFKPEPVVKGTVELGFSESVIIPLGIVLTVCAILYLIPQTAILGAILLHLGIGLNMGLIVFSLFALVSFLRPSARGAAGGRPS